MRWVMPLVIALSMSFSPMLFPNSSAMADFIERNLEAVGPQPQDMPASLLLNWQCVCVMGPEPQWYLLGGHYWRFLDPGETEPRGVDVQLDEYQSPSYAHWFFLWHTTAKGLLMRKQVKRGPAGQKAVFRQLVLPQKADEQSSTAARLIQGTVVTHLVEVDFRVGRYVGYLDVIEPTLRFAQSEALRLTTLLTNRIRAKG